MLSWAFKRSSTTDDTPKQDEGATTPASSATTRAEQSRTQVLKDYKLAVEYKFLKRQCVGGVYVLPSLSDLRTWYGVIFVRRGMYSNGIFKFRVELPPDYNDVGTWPRVIFSLPIAFNPCIDPKTGELDVKGAYPEWLPDQHYVVTVLTHLKKVFYMKDYQDAKPANPEAQKLFQTDKAEFLRRVEECVARSQSKPEHEALLDMIFANTEAEGEEGGEHVPSRRLNVLEAVANLSIARGGEPKR